LGVCAELGLGVDKNFNKAIHYSIPHTDIL